MPKTHTEVRKFETWWTSPPSQKGSQLDRHSLGPFSRLRYVDSDARHLIIGSASSSDTTVRTTTPPSRLFFVAPVIPAPG
jgi:hypothetical protein